MVELLLHVGLEISYIQIKNVIQVVSNPEKRLALENSPSDMKWSIEQIDIPGLTNIDEAKQDFNGKANTAAIKAYNSSLSRFPAAKYAYNYTTTGTNVGEWYLPALGELNTVYSNKDFLNYALSLVGKKDIPTNDYHWSSSEYSGGLAWILYFYNGNPGYYLKTNDGYVRPVLAF